MKYTARHLLKGSLEEVLEIVMDRSRDPRVYPNITSLKELKNHDTGDEIFCEYHIRGDADIPVPLRVLASPKLLTWVEIGCWDKKRNTYTYELQPHFFRNIVHAKGTIRFAPVDEFSVLREIDAEMRIDIPVLGDLAAKTVIAYQLDNYRREEKLFDKYLEEYRIRKICFCDKE